MDQSIVRVAFPVFDYVMRRLDPVPPAGSDSQRQQAYYDLAQLVNAARPADEALHADGRIPDKVSGLHYLLASWVDEIFILHSPWSDRWKDNRLTSHFPMYKGEAKLENVRGDRVRKLAMEALSASRFDILEVYLLVFHLGFGGFWPDNGQRDEWLEEAERAVEVWEEKTNMKTPPTSAGAGLPGPAPTAPAPLPVPRGRRGDAALAARFAMAWLLAAVVLAAAVAVRTVLAVPPPPAPVVEGVR